MTNQQKINISALIAGEQERAAREDERQRLAVEETMRHERERRESYARTVRQTIQAFGSGSIQS